MWRYIFSFVMVSILTAVAFAVIAPTAGFFEDVIVIGLGVIAIFLFGNEIFLHALLPTEGEVSGINKLLKTNPKWKRHLIIIGAVSGFISAMLFFMVSAKMESILVVGIPIGIFFVCILFLQYILPKILLSSSSCDNDNDADIV